MTINLGEIFVYTPYTYFGSLGDPYDMLGGKYVSKRWWQHQNNDTIAHITHIFWLLSCLDHHMEVY
jgi:hypothetical protein